MSNINEPDCDVCLCTDSPKCNNSWVLVIRAPRWRIIQLWELRSTTRQPKRKRWQRHHEINDYHDKHQPLYLFLHSANKPLIKSTKVTKFPSRIYSVSGRRSDISATEGVTSLKKVRHQWPKRDLQPWHKRAVLVRLALSNKSFGQQ